MKSVNLLIKNDTMEKEILLWPMKPAKCPKCGNQVRTIFYSKNNSNKYGKIDDLIEVDGSSYIYGGPYDASNNVNWQCIMCGQQYKQGVELMDDSRTFKEYESKDEITNYSSIEELFDAMKDPSQVGYDEIAINLIQNFCIEKQEEDSFGKRDVRFNIAELEIYLYNKENDDWPTYNRDCLAGQWFVHKSGVDIAFQTIREGKELIQFGGVLIRGLERIVDGKVEAYIGGPQRCLSELFNSSYGMPKLCFSHSEEKHSINKTKRVNVSLDMETETQLRYFRHIPASKWNAPQVAITTKREKKQYFVYKKESVVKYAYAPEKINEDEFEGTKVYPR